MQNILQLLPKAIGKIYLFSTIVISTNALAIGPIEFAKTKFYNHLSKIDYLSFDLYSSEVEKVIKSKTVLNVKDEIVAKVTIKNGEVSIELKGVDNFPTEIKSALRNEYYLKAKLLTGMNLRPWLNDYKFNRVSGGWHIYKDDTGLDDIFEKWVKVYSDKISLIEKKATGVQKTHIYFKKFKWSKNKVVPHTIRKQIYEGGQSIELSSQIFYELLDC